MSLHLTLSAEQLAELQRAIVTNDRDLPVARLRIIELSAQGHGVPEISRVVDIHEINVRKWIHRYEQQGIDGLRSGKSSGRPVLFDAATRAVIALVGQTNPARLGLPFRAWSITRLRAYLVDGGIVEQVSREMVRSIVKGI